MGLLGSRRSPHRNPGDRTRGKRRTGPGSPSDRGRHTPESSPTRHGVAEARSAWNDLSCSRTTLGDLVVPIRAKGPAPGAVLTSATVHTGCVYPPVGRFLAGITAQAADVAAETAHSTPLNRFLEPEVIAGAVCFLNSPKASAITGAELSAAGSLVATI